MAYKTHHPPLIPGLDRKRVLAERLAELNGEILKIAPDRTASEILSGMLVSRDKVRDELRELGA